MSDKSYVTLEQAVCPVCGQAHDTGNLLLDRRLRETFEHKTATHWAMCPEHRELYDNGFIALVGVDEKKTAGHYEPDKVWRTGNIAHLREEAWGRVFNVPMPEKGLCWVPDEVIEMLVESSPDGGQPEEDQAQ